MPPLEDLPGMWSLNSELENLSEMGGLYPNQQGFTNGLQQLEGQGITQVSQSSMETPVPRAPVVQVEHVYVSVGECVGTHVPQGEAQRGTKIVCAIGTNGEGQTILGICHAQRGIFEFSHHCLQNQMERYGANNISYYVIGICLSQQTQNMILELHQNYPINGWTFLDNTGTPPIEVTVTADGVKFSTEQGLFEEDVLDNDSHLSLEALWNDHDRN